MSIGFDPCSGYDCLAAAENLDDRGIWIVPDIIAHSGGVICAATEYKGLTADDAFTAIHETRGRNTKELLRRVRDPKSYPHAAVLAMAREPIVAAIGHTTTV